MRPAALTGLATLASMTCIAPASAQTNTDESKGAATGCGAGVAAIIAERRKGEAGTWAGLDRDRLASRFRLTGARSEPQVAGPPDGPRAPLAASAAPPSRQKAAPVGAARAHAPLRRGISFGINGLPDLQPSGDGAEPVPIRSSEEGLPQSSACEGLMPAMACTTLASTSVGPRLALAYNF